jgi:anti-anti-sigma factor
VEGEGDGPVSEIGRLEVRRSGRTMIAGIEGEIDLSNTSKIRHRLASSLTNEDQAIVLDLSRLSYIDSAGLRLVFDLAARLREHRQQLHIVAPSDSQPWRVIQIMGLETAGTIHSTLAEAERRLGVAGDR